MSEKDEHPAFKALGEAVGVLLLCHSLPEGRKLLSANKGIQQFLQDNLNGILPVITGQLVARDRRTVHMTMQNILKNRKTRKEVGEEMVNLEAYAAVLGDLEDTHRQVKPPQLNLIPREDGVKPPTKSVAPHQVGLSEVSDDSGTKAAIGTPVN